MNLKIRRISLFSVLIWIFLAACSKDTPESRTSASVDSTVLESAMAKAGEGRATEMTLAEMDAFRLEQKRQAEDHKRKIQAQPKPTPESPPPPILTGELGLWLDNYSPPLLYYVQLVPVKSDQVEVIETFMDGGVRKEVYRWNGSEAHSGNSDGDYYKFKDGSLSCWDNEGYIYSLEKLR
jgi:hypothetical protein